ncbi:neuropeptide CCHamide-2 [Aricia agestis]|uniref:neuropeptide CCHamide-2 n=1 Tax=Aricia agestis TaxID=91739 RepID=UPI001C2024B2|nr:neuropeptide CCHamide-2 [Aricia agestis]
MAQNMFAVSVLAILVVSVGVGAKRGCSAFGHSCFGGHGKRSGDSPLGSSSSNELVARNQLGQEETPPHPVYPHNYGMLPSGDDIIPIRDGGVFDREESARDVMKMKLQNIFKHWMDSYRRSQQTDDSYLLDTL